MARKSNGDVDPIVTGEVATRGSGAFQAMVRDMAAIATAESEDGPAFMTEALAAIYGAETEDELWEADMSGPINAQFLGGCELDILNLAVKYSRGGDDSDIQTPWVAADGRQMYLLVTAVRISNAGEKRNFRLPKVGEEFQFNTSAQFLTAKLMGFYRRGRIGQGNVLRAMIQETKLDEKRKVLKLTRVPERVMSGQATIPDSEAPF